MAAPRRLRYRRSRSALTTAGALIIASGVLAACSSDDGGENDLVWYINPDAGGQDEIAANCTEQSGGEYTISTQVLPQDAGQQRIQLARRLAAGDPEIDIMSLDPPFTAEFSAAGYLAEIPSDLQTKFEEQAFASAVDAATWEDQLVVAPFWSNTQVLWYRKSFVDKAGLNMSQPVSWDQIITAAADNDGTVAVQANKYEGYSVWVNALVSGAGGEIATDTEQGADATITINSEAGQAAADVVEELTGSDAAPADLSVSNEGTAATSFAADTGAFMVNWTFIWNNYGEERLDDDIGFAPYPETVQGEESAPPYGGIGLAVSNFSEHKDAAMKAIDCLTTPENQGVNAELTGNMPSSPAGYDYPPLAKLYDAKLLALFQESLERAAPRTVSPYWSDMSGAILSTWHPPSGVNDQTPDESATFMEEVLQGESLL
ncbi:MAG TPA: extracellular solute-binding protein [Intrasporangium sp.]|nr:extracellular solute-binding protein [Intrasporangium sp.]